MLLHLQGSEQEPRCLNAPGIESAFQLLPVFCDWNFLLAVFVDLIDNKIQRFSPVTEIFGECQIIFGLHMIVIHYIEDYIGQMQRRAGRRLMTIIGRVNSRRVHQHTMRPQDRNLLPHLNS
ncbi:hypothetical protein D3C80_1786850 [compost metagenome]